MEVRQLTVLTARVNPGAGSGQKFFGAAAPAAANDGGMFHHRFTLLLVLPALVCSRSVSARADDRDAARDAPGDIAVTRWLVLDETDVRGRQPFNPDAVFDRYLLDPSAPPPSAGDQVTGTIGAPRTWTELDLSDAGADPGFTPATAYATVERDEPGVFLVGLLGGSTLFVNGECYAGDGYGLGFDGVPVRLEKGENRIFASGLRGPFHLRLRPVQGRAVLGVWDATLPHVLRGESLEAPAAIPLLNVTGRTLRDVVIVAGGTDGFTAKRVETGLAVPPFGLSKIPFDVELPAAPPDGKDTLSLRVVALASGEEVARATLDMPVKGAGEAHLRTFRSRIDGSVQRYGVLPPSEEGADHILLTLHGAGVAPMNQVRAYAPKPDCFVIAPTNRRQFGFDWQDWGRTDAYEALGDALASTGVPHENVYLSGHSMGGHGTWHLAANDPDRFIAIAPSAGWISFDTYGPGRPAGVLQALWHGADGASDTPSLLGNLTQQPTYVLHGEADDNVPASEAHRMVELYEEAGAAVESHFEAGAGHWWNLPDTPGADCVDWPGILDLFRASRPRTAPESLAFTTVDPSVDAEHHWLRVEQPLAYGTPVRVEAHWDGSTRTVVVSSTNARTLRVGAPAGAAPEHYVVDGTPIDTDSSPIWVTREEGRDGAWRRIESGPPPAEKSAQRCGPFKRAFDRRFVLVVPTGGTREETTAARARARYDAEVWHYRGNGLAETVTDTEFVAAAATRFAGRNAVLYGNADTNGAWRTVFPVDGPIDVRRGAVRVGDREYEGDGLGCVFVRPRADDDAALAAAFGDTGVAGCRLGYRLMPFISGVGYPDYAVFDASFLEKSDLGVLAAGWFDARWQFDGRGFRAFGGRRVDHRAR